MVQVSWAVEWPEHYYQNVNIQKLNLEMLMKDTIVLKLLLQIIHYDILSVTIRHRKTTKVVEGKLRSKVANVSTRLDKIKIDTVIKYKQPSIMIP